MPNLTGPPVVALLYDGLCTFEFGIVAEVFGLSRPEMGPTWYRFASCAFEDGPLRAHGGFSLMPEHGIEVSDRADIVVCRAGRAATRQSPRISAIACAQPTRGVRGSPRSAPARSCSLRPGFSTAAARPRTGATPRRCASATPPSQSITPRSIAHTVDAGRRDALFVLSRGSPFGMECTITATELAREFTVRRWTMRAAFSRGGSRTPQPTRRCAFGNGSGSSRCPLMVASAWAGPMTL